MNTYMITVALQIQVEAFSKADAVEAIEDAIGPGDLCGLIVVDTEIQDIEQL